MYLNQVMFNQGTFNQGTFNQGTFNQVTLHRPQAMCHNMFNHHKDMFNQPTNNHHKDMYHKDMFRSETSVIDTVIPPAINERSTTVVKSHDLPYYSKFLLCAAYLASYNPPRADAQLFTKAGVGKKRKRGGGLNKQAGTRKIPQRLLGPQSFPIERLSAIFATLTPHTVLSSVDIQAPIATLTSLRLLVKASNMDPLDGGAKWKVNVGWESIRSIARSIQFNIEDYMIE